jgi:hypothetical protein
MRPEGPLDALAEMLAAPARSGVYLTRNELLILARLSEASLRVGERRRMLADVLKSAGSTEDLAGTLDRLRAFCAESLVAYEGLAAAAPASAAVLAPWIERARGTISKLETLAAEVRL